MTTTGTFFFGESQSDQLIVDAFERIGILPDEITAQQIQSAQRSANLLLSEWISRGLNFWTIKKEMLGLTPNQSTYYLPIATSDVLTAAIRTNVRNLGGTPISSAGGVAEFAFDADPATACTQTAPNGYISYNYGFGVQMQIGLVGIQSNSPTIYNLVFEYSPDNINWYESYTPSPQEYRIGEKVWFAIPVPVSAQAYRVRETGGAILNVQELYFNSAMQDTQITRISFSEYDSLPQKNQRGRPTSFYVDRQVNPSITLWPTPIEPYNNLYYRRVAMIQDIGSLQNMADIPQRFFEPLCAGLALKLAIKYASRDPSSWTARLGFLEVAYEKSFDLAAREDSEKTPLRIYGQYFDGWSQE